MNGSNDESFVLRTNPDFCSIFETEQIEIIQDGNTYQFLMNLKKKTPLLLALGCLFNLVLMYLTYPYTNFSFLDYFFLKSERNDSLLAHLLVFFACIILFVFFLFYYFFRTRHKQFQQKAVKKDLLKKFSTGFKVKITIFIPYSMTKILKTNFGGKLNFKSKINSKVITTKSKLTEDYEKSSSLKKPNFALNPFKKKVKIIFPGMIDIDFNGSLCNSIPLSLTNSYNSLKHVPREIIILVKHANLIQKDNILTITNFSNTENIDSGNLIEEFFRD